MTEKQDQMKYGIPGSHKRKILDRMHSEFKDTRNLNFRNVLLNPYGILFDLVPEVRLIIWGFSQPISLWIGSYWHHLILRISIINTHLYCRVRLISQVHKDPNRWFQTQLEMLQFHTGSLAQGISDTKSKWIIYPFYYSFSNYHLH